MMKDCCMMKDGKTKRKNESNKMNNMASMNNTCPMYPEVSSDKPGKCSKSEMDSSKKVVITGAYAINSEYKFRKGSDPMEGMKM